MTNGFHERDAFFNFLLLTSLALFSEESIPNDFLPLYSMKKTYLGLFSRKQKFFGFREEFPSFSELSQFPNLISLEISSPELRTLDGLELLKNLDYLNLSNSGLITIRGIKKARN